MKSPELSHQEITPLKSVEEQTRHGELPSIILFERLQNPVIRKQILDLLEASEQAQKGEMKLFTLRDEKGKPLRRDDGKFKIEHRPYVPVSREQLEKEYELSLYNTLTRTDISFGDEQPNVGRMTLNWKFPDAIEKPDKKQMAIIEAHEKGHRQRPYGGKYLRALFSEAFDEKAVEFTRDDYFRNYTKKARAKLGYEEAKKHFFRYLFSASELAERMSQLKNYFGMRGSEEFTKEHLEYAREHYVKDVGFDNVMTPFFTSITPEKEEAFIKLINSAGI